MSDDLLLTSLWSIPLAGALIVLLLPRRAEQAIKGVALAVTLITFALTLVALSEYLAPHSAAAAPLRERAAKHVLSPSPDGLSLFRGQNGADPDHDLMMRSPWIPYFNIEYYLGLDGISLSLIVLTGFVSVLACLASFSIDKQVKGYFSLYLLLTASMIGVFLSLDLFLFYVFFEVMLLPMYFLIAVWGGGNREYSAIKFLLYTLFGSVFILVGVLILYFGGGGAAVAGFSGHSFDIVMLTRVATETSYYSASTQEAVFLLLFIGFCIKLPSFPFHTWLPDAHVDAPTPISMILAGVLLKIGGYGMIRLAWPLAPIGALAYAWPVAALGVFSILYGALVAMAQTDFKKLVAYSSVSHMGYVTLGLAVMNMAGGGKYYAYGVNGAMFMMIAHGITSTGMFFLVGVIYDRAHTRDLRQLGGLNNIMPGYSAVSYLIFFGSMGLPTLCGFIAEVFVILAAFHYSPLLGTLAAAGVVLTAGYVLWTIQRVFLGRNEQWKGLPDLTVREWAISVPLVVMTVLLGVAPQWALLSWMGPSVQQTVNAVERGSSPQRLAGYVEPAPNQGGIVFEKEMETPKGTVRVRFVD